MVYEGFDAVCFYLFLTIETKEFFYFKLYGQTMGIPTGLAKHVVALHCLISGNYILDASS